MKKECILHIPMSNYAHGISETRLCFRIRTAKNDIDRCFLYYGDTACRQTPILFHREVMKVVASDEWFDYYEVEMESPYQRIYYYFELWDKTESTLYYSDFFREGRVDDRSEYYKLPFNRREDLVQIPEWVKEAVIYNIFPDSFATAGRQISNRPGTGKHGNLTTHSKLGGTIRGITENVDYIRELGINCIYINPIFAAGEYHKYDTIDYFSVDPCFGTNEDFRELVAVFHEKGIRVIIDGVFNHCGWQFFAFEDVISKGEDSHYKNWFYRLSYPVVRPESPEEIPGYECFAYERMMPKLNTSDPEVMEYLLKVGAYWVREFDIDGWRLDVASEVDDGFWRAFRKEVKAVKPDCFIIGEVWENAAHWLDGSQFDSTMNYDLRKHCNYFFAQESISAAAFDARVTNMRMRYKKNMLWGQLNLLDSHDVSRFYSVCGGDMRKWKLAVLFQMMFIGAPSVFYGDEQMLKGMLEEEYRQPMKWDTLNPAFLFYQKAIALRKTHRAVSHGDYETLSAGEGSSLYAFRRFCEEEEIIVILNAGNRAVEASELIRGRRVLWQEELCETTVMAYGFVILTGCCKDGSAPV